MSTELIKINTNADGRRAVSGRELHEFLGIETRYNDWFARMVEYGFTENQDYLLVTQKRETNNPKNPLTEIIDHAITIEMAKEICMIQRSEKGKQARLYFIECERRLNEPPSLEQQVANGLFAANKLISRLQSQIETNRPKVVFADAVSVSKTSILVSELAKILCQNGMDIGGKRLFERFRNEGFLCVRGSEWNMPTQRSVDNGLFEIKETVVTHADGHTTISKTPKVTGKGQVYFVNRYLGKRAVCDEPETGGLTITAYYDNERKIS